MRPPADPFRHRSPPTDWLRRLPGVGLLRLAGELLHGGPRRGSALLRAWPPDQLFQPYPDTTERRYEGIFRFVRGQMADGPEVRLLSFGCSSGEELFSLRQHFPQARIKGIDINRRAVSVARRRLAAAGDAGLTATVAGTAAGEASGTYDAVFAMAVFRHGDLGAAPPTCDRLIPFARFEAEIAELARCLRPGGLLVIRHANFRPADTRLATAFEPLLSRETPETMPSTPLYGPDNRLIAARTEREDVVFRKIG